MVEITTTKHQAYVSIVNKTGRPILYAAISHKYSDVFKDALPFTGPIAPGETTTVDKNFHKVSYHTGITTTGRDWWIVTWCYEDGDHEAYHTAPQNFRGVLDWLEWGTHWGAWLIGFVTGGFLEKLPVWAAKLGIEAKWLGRISEGVSEATKVKKVAAAIACAWLVEKGTNTEETLGYKQHILRAEDAGKTTHIEIDSNNNATFKSHSGKSQTISKRIEVPKLPDVT
jgi:hypothetical protein